MSQDEKLGQSLGLAAIVVIVIIVAVILGGLGWLLLR